MKIFLLLILPAIASARVKGGEEKKLWVHPVVGGDGQQKDDAAALVKGGDEQIILSKRAVVEDTQQKQVPEGPCQQQYVLSSKDECSSHCVHYGIFEVLVQDIPNEGSDGKQCTSQFDNKLGTCNMGECVPDMPDNLQRQNLVKDGNEKQKTKGPCKKDFVLSVKKQCSYHCISHKLDVASIEIIPNLDAVGKRCFNTYRFRKGTCSYNGKCIPGPLASLCGDKSELVSRDECGFHCGEHLEKGSAYFTIAVPGAVGTLCTHREDNKKGNCTVSGVCWAPPEEVKNDQDQRDDDATTENSIELAPAKGGPQRILNPSYDAYY